MPGSEDEGAGMLDTHMSAQIEGAVVQARGATGERSGEQVANEVPAWLSGSDVRDLEAIWRPGDQVVLAAPRVGCRYSGDGSNGAAAV